MSHLTKGIKSYSYSCRQTESLTVHNNAYSFIYQNQTILRKAALIC